MTFSSLKTKLLTGVTLFAVAGAASAQDASEKEEKVLSLEEIVVTGTSKARSSFSTPVQVTSISEDQLRKFTASSQADILRSVTGIKAEGGGGEVAANVFIKGLPSGGQFQFTPLLYDGVASFSTFGLNSSAFDVYYRNDLGIERVEFVRGGVSNLFGPGSVAGVINYISKTGEDEPEGQVQFEVAEEGRYRADFAASGPLSADEGLYYAMSGYYRYDEGPLDSGLPTEGYQIRGNIKKEFGDGSGSVTLYTQVIDDKVQFFLPFPLDGDTRERPTGNDGETIYTLQTRDASRLSYQTPDGVFETPIADGVSTQGATFALAFEKELENGWGFNGKVKYSDYDHQFNLFLDGDGIANTPETQAGFLAARGLGDLAGASFTFTESGQALGANDLLFANRILDRDRPATDFTSELNVTKTFDAGDWEHSFTFGGFFANAEAADDNVISTYLGEFNDQPRLVDLTYTDENGNPVVFSLNGLTNAGVIFSNREHTAKRIAGYIADQFENDRWVFDVGFRVERFVGDFFREGTTTAVINDDPGFAPGLQSVVTGDGSFQIGSVSTTEWAVALGALYRLNDNVNLYGNFSRGFFFPQLRSVRVNSLGETASYDAEIIKQAEVGVKYGSANFAATFSAFYAELDNRANVDFVNDGNGGVVEEVSLQSTKSYGIEATASYNITETLRVDANVTLQDHELTQNDGNPALIGNELRRQPNLLFNAGVYYDDDTFDVSFFQNYVGDNFANDSNSVELDAFSIFRLDAGYSFGFGGEKNARIGLGVFNLFDSQGTTEGSPRQGTSQSNTGNFFVGRPVLPRRVTLRFNYKF
ncbi:TonB-dependent receptor [Kordiimonas sp. SCSIO 12603]|uniref:TonB-dependent receptor n=1 Tax=Kordiimonas sp. SCSIO 12603 TaxID=2829596 RepID=UPI002107682D|nr:TonB-dependent receptor [Kordiimonas sp. SCSIO 12603]UTW60198.1 TonB-dependent receptor [Kordiimonas sp. SCSIO 12603]